MTRDFVQILSNLPEFLQILFEGDHMDVKMRVYTLEFLYRVSSQMSGNLELFSHLGYLR